MHAEPIHGRRLAAVTTAVLLALLLVALDQFIVGSALPRIILELHGLDSYSWVLTAYLVSLTTITPIAGKLGDLFGRRRLLLVGMLGFAASSVVCGQAADMRQLIAFRAVQGLFGGLIFSNVFASVADLYAIERRVRVQGALGAVFAIASLIGPTIGGFLADGAGWRWVFYVNVPVTALSVVLLALTMPRIRITATIRDVDLLGAFLLVGGIVPLLFVLSTTRDLSSVPATAQALLVISAIAVVALFFVERRARQPIVPLRLFLDRTFAVAVGVGLFVYVAFFAALLFVPLIYQGVLGTRASDSGVLVTPLLLGVIAGSGTAGMLMVRLRRYRFVGTFAIVLVAIGCAMLAQVAPDTSQPDVVRDLVVLGIGVGITIPLYLNTAQAAVGPRFVGVVTSQVQFFRQVGGTIGVAVLGSVLSARLPATADLGTAQLDLPLPVRLALASGIHDVFIGAMCSALIGAAVSTFLREVQIRQQTTRPDGVGAPVAATGD